MASPQVGFQQMPPMSLPPAGNPQTFALPFGLPQMPQQFSQIPQQLAQIPQMIPGMPNWSAPTLPNASQLGAAAMTMLPPALQNLPPQGFNPFMTQGAAPLGASPMPGGFNALA